MARVKLAYPKIPGSKNAPSGHCIAFEKYDGTNLHWVWDRELGWYALGMQGFAKPLEAVFRTNPAYNSPEITVFTEFVGPNSFAGME